MQVRSRNSRARGGWLPSTSASRYSATTRSSPANSSARPGPGLRDRNIAASRSPAAQPSVRSHQQRDVRFRQRVAVQPQELVGLPAVEGQVSAADLVQAAADPQPMQRQHRVGAADQHQPQRRLVPQQRRDGCQDLRVVDDLEIVHHQHRPRRQVVQRPPQRRRPCSVTPCSTAGPVDGLPSGTAPDARSAAVTPPQNRAGSLSSRSNANHATRRDPAPPPRYRPRPGGHRQRFPRTGGPLTTVTGPVTASSSRCCSRCRRRNPPGTVGGAILVPSNPPGRRPVTATRSPLHPPVRARTPGRSVR